MRHAFGLWKMKGIGMKTKLIGRVSLCSLCVSLAGAPAAAAFEDHSTHSANEPKEPEDAALESAKQLRAITMGIIDFGALHDGQPPESIEVMLKQRGLSPDLLVSPMNPANDGGPDYSFRLTQEAVSSFKGSYIVGVDRAAYVHGEDAIYVAFADSHVEMLSRAMFLAMLEMPVNLGAMQDLELDRADAIRSAHQLREVAMGLIDYASEHGDKPPSSLSILVDEHIIEPSVFRSPLGPARDGGAEYGYRLTNMAVSSFDGQFVVGLDRAAYVNGREYVYVVFADTHAEALDREQIRKLLDLALNKGAREDLGIE